MLFYLEISSKLNNKKKNVPYFIGTLIHKLRPNGSGLLFPPRATFDMLKATDFGTVKPRVLGHGCFD